MQKVHDLYGKEDTDSTNLCKNGLISPGLCGTHFVRKISGCFKRKCRAEGGSTVKKQYRFVELSKGEREYHEMILMEEIEVQAWFAITYSSIFAEEIFLTIQ